MNKQQLNKAYEALAAELGDTEYKLGLLKAKKQIIVKKIDELNKLAAKNETQENKTEGRAD